MPTSSYSESLVLELLDLVTTSPARPSPYSARTASDFLDRLRKLKTWSGLSFETLERRAEEMGHTLPHSTTARWLAKDNDSRLPDDVQLTAFVLACGLSKDQWRDWVLVWADVYTGGKGYVPMALDRLRSSRVSGFPARITPTAVMLKDGTITRARSCWGLA